MTLEHLDSALREEVSGTLNGRQGEAAGTDHNRVPPATGRQGTTVHSAGRKEPLLAVQLQLLPLPLQPPCPDRSGRRGNPRLRRRSGAVRFIDGTYSYHIALEKRVADFIANRPQKSSTPPIPPTATRPCDQQQTNPLGRRPAQPQFHYPAMRIAACPVKTSRSTGITTWTISAAALRVSQ